jgi:hypothetical protein
MNVDTTTTHIAEPVTVVTPLTGVPWGDVLAVQFDSSGQVFDLLRAAQWLERQEAEAPRGVAGVALGSLSADVILSGARYWIVTDPAVQPEDLPDGGTVLRPAPVEPDDPAVSWGIDGLTVRADAMLVFAGDGSAWAEIDLAAVWEQVR